MKHLFDKDAAVAIMHEYGGSMSLHGWARICLQRPGIVSEELRTRGALEYLKKKLKDVAREVDERGLPRFGQTLKKDDDSGEAIYAQPELWSCDDALLNIRVRLEKRNQSHVRLMRMIEWFEDRYAVACPFRPSAERLPDLDYGDDD